MRDMFNDPTVTEIARFRFGEYAVMKYPVFYLLGWKHLFWRIWKFVGEEDNSGYLATDPRGRKVFWDKKHIGNKIPKWKRSIMTVIQNERRKLCRPSK